MKAVDVEPRYERCSYCRIVWNVDIEKVVPSSGYVCPWCDKRKRTLRSGHSLKVQK